MTTRDFAWDSVIAMATEIRQSAFAVDIEARRREYPSTCPMGLRDCALLYALTRWRRPKTIVETGGFVGMASAFMLKALQDEGVTEARLYSVEWMTDFPHGALVPPDLQKWFVPLTGKIEDFMKTKSSFPPQIDMFLHDSSHRYKHMLMEYKFFWSRLTDGGLLVSHDVNLSAAFLDFVSKTYRHDRLGQTDLDRSGHSHWGRWGNMGFAVKQVRTR